MKTHQTQFQINAMCHALSVSRSGYYAWKNRSPSPRTRENQRLLACIKSIHERSQENYGAQKTWKVLRASGESCGRHRVARLRQQHGIIAKRIRLFRRAYKHRHSAPPAPNLLNRNFAVSQPNRVWVSDITFVPTRRGWLYVATMLDLYSKKIVGWAMSQRIDSKLVIDALLMAIQQRKPKPGLVIHSDQGQQYTASDFRLILTQHGIVQSMSRKGECLDNAVAESFFSNLKNELVRHTIFEDRQQARTAIFEYVEIFYNRNRIHQSLGYVSPVDFEKANRVS